MRTSPMTDLYIQIRTKCIERFSRHLIYSWPQKNLDSNVLRENEIYHAMKKPITFRCLCKKEKNNIKKPLTIYVENGNIVKLSQGKCFK